LKNKKYGMLVFSQEVLKDLLQMPDDWEITDARYDGFRRVVELAINGSTDNLRFVAEGAALPGIDHIIKVKSEK